MNDSWGERRTAKAAYIFSQGKSVTVAAAGTRRTTAPTALHDFNSNSHAVANSGQVYLLCLKVNLSLAWEQPPVAE